VAKLRSLGREIRSDPFPGVHDHNNLKGQIAIGAKALTKQFGDCTAVKNVNVQIA